MVGVTTRVSIIHINFIDEMKIRSKFLDLFHLNEKYFLLTAREASILFEFFKALDIRDEMAIDGTGQKQP